MASKWDPEWNINRGELAKLLTEELSPRYPGFDVYDTGSGIAIVKTIGDDRRGVILKIQSYELGEKPY